MCKYKNYLNKLSLNYNYMNLANEKVECLFVGIFIKYEIIWFLWKHNNHNQDTQKTTITILFCTDRLSA